MSNNFKLFPDQVLSELCEGANHRKVKTLRDLQRASEALFDELKSLQPEKRYDLTQSNLLKKAGANKHYLTHNPEIKKFVVVWLERIGLQFPRQTLAKSSDIVKERDCAFHEAMAYHQKFLQEQGKVKKLEDQINQLKQENETLLSQLANKPNNVVKLGD